MIIPYFTTTYSIGRGLFTLDEPAPIKTDAPLSVFSVAKEHNLAEVYLIENSFTGFMKAYKTSQKCGIPFRFGYKLCICDDENDKSEASFTTESNVVIWPLNTKGYSDAIKISSRAATDGFYYIPRLSWRTLKQMWTENLGLSIPFYGGFIARNSLKNGVVCPDFPIKPVMILENHLHPIDQILTPFILDYCAANEYKTQQMHKTLYYQNDDVTAFLTYRLITSRSNGKASLNNPNIEDMSMDTFSWEYFQKNL